MAHSDTLRCNVPESYSRESMKRLIRLNCDKAGPILHCGEVIQRSLVWYSIV